MQDFATAREAFYAGNLKNALKLIELEIKGTPRNPDLHQFRSLVLFSMKKYDQAAAAAHVALTAGPGWNWKALNRLFPKTEIYTTLLRDLEQSRNTNKSSPAIRFLLAYHYLMLDHVKSAVRELEIIVELEPRDQLSAKLLQSITGKNVQPMQAVPTSRPVEQPQTTTEYNTSGLGALGNMEIAAEPTTPTEMEEVEEVEETQDAPKVESLIGTFRASPADGVEFKIMLNADQTFKWTFKSKVSTSSFEGTYTIDGNKFTLVRKTDGDKMVGIVAFNDNVFHFKMQDGDPKDPGLNFLR